MGEHAAPSLRSVGNLGHEGGAERRAVALSILDGWWIEGCAEDVTGLGDRGRGLTTSAEASSLYDKLDQRIAPLYAKPNAWARMQQHCIAMNGSFFNTDRMLGQYFSNAYFPQAPVSDETPFGEETWGEGAAEGSQLLTGARVSA